MNTRRGQVALYLVLVLVAITLFVMMNVSTFLLVRAKNRATNAGDAAALAAAAWQRRCLNRIGDLNLEHLQLVVATTDPAGVPAALERCEEIVREQKRICLLEPVRGVHEANVAARSVGVSPNEEMRELMLQHVVEVRSNYCTTPDLYPPAWSDSPGDTSAWELYAQALEQAFAEEMYAGPDNIEYVDVVGGHMLLNQQFYHAIAGCAWCWFKFNAPGLLDSYDGWKSWAPLPEPDDETRRRACMNSEVFSLHLTTWTGSLKDILTDAQVLAILPGCSQEDLNSSVLVTNRNQTWFFYDTRRDWQTWSTYPGIRFNPTEFPIVGDIKPEYDVKGGAAICRVTDLAPAGLLTPDDDDGSVRVIEWTAAAKPFGTVTDAEGRLSDVTSFNGFVTPAFEEERLVPIDSVGARDLSTADVGWMRHVREHLRECYLVAGPTALPGGCYYCEQLRVWEKAELRQKGKDYLKYHGADCKRPTNGTCIGCGGTAHGH